VHRPATARAHAAASAPGAAAGSRDTTTEVSGSGATSDDSSPPCSPSAAHRHTYTRVHPPPPLYSDQKGRESERGQEMALGCDGQIPNLRAVRVHVSTGQSCGDSQLFHRCDPPQAPARVTPTQSQPLATHRLSVHRALCISSTAARGARHAPQPRQLIRDSPSETVASAQSRARAHPGC
jgi:hypothetical protein